MIALKCFSQIEAYENIEKLPGELGRRCNFKARFAISQNQIIEWGVKSFYASVQTQDGRVKKSNTYIVDFPTDYRGELTVAEAIQRKARIDNFVNRCERQHLSRQMEFPNYSIHVTFAHAGVLQLRDDSEVREACAILEKKNVPIAFKEGDWEKDVLGFFKKHWGHGVSPGGVAWQITPLYNAWFGGPVTISSPNDNPSIASDVAAPSETTGQNNNLSNIHSSLVAFIRDGRKLLQQYGTIPYSYTLEQVAAIEKWQDAVEYYLVTNLGEYAQMEFQKPQGNGGSMLVDEHYPRRLRSSKVVEQLAVLDKIIANPKQFMPPS